MLQFTRYVIRMRRVAVTVVLDNAGEQMLPVTQEPARLTVTVAPETQHTVTLDGPMLNVTGLPIRHPARTPDTWGLQMGWMAGR
jgi:hypothetical protein